jgi:signal transduction histidine kinase
VNLLSVELSALGFQAVVTVFLAGAYYRLWSQTRRPYFGSWAAAWGLYALRLAAISIYLAERRPVWLFLHLAITGLTAMLLLWGALQWAQGRRWRAPYAFIAALPVAWAAVAIFAIPNPVVGATSSAALLALVTLWTAAVFLRYWLKTRATGSGVLALAFALWGFHHLDYPLLRALGSAVLYGVFADVLFIVATAVGTLFMVLSEGRRALEERATQLEQLTRLLLRTQEDERRRIARELHDEAGQVLTAVKIELDLEGRTEAGAMVGRALAQVRDLSNLLRPAVLDDLGLVPALRGLCEDFARRTRIEATLEVEEPAASYGPEVEVVIYRVVQEALTNVARHAGASSAHVCLDREGAAARLVVADDGRGVSHEMTPHLGLLGMRERVTELGGTLQLGGGAGAGFRIEVFIPGPEAA